MNRMRLAPLLVLCAWSSNAAAASHVEASRPELAASGAAARARPDYRLATALALSGAYTSFGVWSWFAWYRARPKTGAYRVGGDGWFGPSTYAGGADKLGHAWATLALSRLGAELLESGGWGRTAATTLAASACFAAFSLIELNDGYYTEFSLADLSANSVGVLGAVALRHVPTLDAAIDFRVAWFPSAAFRRSPSADFAEDYAGQEYLLAFKPRVFSALRDAQGVLFALGFVNPVVGFRFRTHPSPTQPVEVHRQTLFLGVTLDLQAITDVTWGARPGQVARVAHGVGHGVFEYVHPPYATLPLLSVRRAGSFAEPPR